MRLLLTAAVLATFVALAAAEDKGTKIELGGESGTTPATWKKIEPKSSVIKRAYQFSLPKAEGDKADAELVVFEGLGGSVQSNVDRWKGQYDTSKGKEGKESKIKVGSAEGDALDISGTYNGPKFDPTFPGKNENFRLIGVQVKIGDTNYHIKLHGPAKTVEKHQKDFEALLKGLKK